MTVDQRTEPVRRSSAENKEKILRGRDLRDDGAGVSTTCGEGEGTASGYATGRLFFHLAEILDVDLFIEAAQGRGKLAAGRRSLRPAPDRSLRGKSRFVHRRFAKVNAPRRPGRLRNTWR